MNALNLQIESNLGGVSDLSTIHRSVCILFCDPNPTLICFHWLLNEVVRQLGGT